MMWTASITRMMFKTSIGIMNSNDQKWPIVITWIRFNFFVVLPKYLEIIHFMVLNTFDELPTLTDIDHGSSMKSSIFHTEKRWSHWSMFNQNMLVLLVWTKLVPYVWNIVQRLEDLRRPIPTLVDSLISWDLCEPPPFPKEGINTQR